MSKKILPVILFLIFSIAFTLSHAADTSSIHWQAWSTAAFSQAKKEHKLILIYGGVSWCHWCQQMEAYSFQDPAVVDFVRTHYIPIHINIEESQALANRYGIEGFPTVLIVDEDNRVLKRHEGYTTPQHLLVILQEN